MSITAAVAESVRARAGHRCEYCCLLQYRQEAEFHIEHVSPIARGGDDLIDNLALACVGCNLRKATRIAAMDPLTGERVPLFNPRLDVWSDHFRRDGVTVVGRTPVGRATVPALKLNRPRLCKIRGDDENDTSAR